MIGLEGGESPGTVTSKILGSNNISYTVISNSFVSSVPSTLMYTVCREYKTGMNAILAGIVVRVRGGGGEGEKWRW